MEKQPTQQYYKGGIVKPTIIQEYKKLYCGLIYDVMKFDMKLDNFVIPRSAGPIIPAWNFGGNVFGKAFTAVGQKVPDPNETVIREMIDDLQQDSVYILQANDNSRAHFGDITAKFLQRAGVQGAIIQGWTRDIEQIEKSGFKIWCKGVQPQDSFDRWHIVDYNSTIVVGNIFIKPTDYLFADRDGVLVIPFEHIDEILALALVRKKKEDKIRSILDDDSLSAKEIYEKIGRW